MARDGNGNFVREYNWQQDAANGVNILAQRMDAEFDGVAVALTNSIATDGQSTITGDIPFGGNKATGLADPTDDQDAVTVAYLRTYQLGNRLVYANRTTTAAAEIDGAITAITIMGYTEQGDGGLANYARVDSEPAHEGKIRTTDRYLSTGIVNGTNGGWWEIQDDTVNVKAFGAKGDGTTDDGAAINNALAYAWSFTTAGGGWTTAQKKVLIPPGRYRTTVSLDFTAFRSYGFEVDATGAVILGEVDGGIVVDALDTRFFTWIGGTIIGASDPDDRPIAGFVHGRRSDNRVADTVVIKDLIVTGHYEIASYANLQAETTHVHNSKFVNFHPGFASTCALLCGNGAYGLTSAYVTPTSSAVSFNCANFYGCDFKTYDSDGTTRGAGYAVRMVTDYTDGAAIRDVGFFEHYSNAIADPNAVSDTDYNVSIFYVDGYVHNLTIEGRSERRGYIDATLRIKNTTNIARIKGLTIREHYMAGRAGLIQAESDDNPVIITDAHISARVSQEAQLGSPLASPHGTIFGPNAARSGSSQLYVYGRIGVPDDSLQSYRLNDFSGCVQFGGVIYTRAGYVNVVPPPAGSYTIYSNSQARHGGPTVFGGDTFFLGSPVMGEPLAIADDGVATWPVRANSYVLVTCSVTTYRAFFFTSKTGVANFTNDLSSNIAFTTGELTGTTGSDTAVTVSTYSADAGATGDLQIENRSGGPLTFNVIFFGAAE